MNENSGPIIRDKNQSENGAKDGLEFRARMLQDSNGYFYAVVVNVAGSDVCRVFGRFTNSADAKNAAYLAAQRFGGTMVYLGKGRRS